MSYYTVANLLCADIEGKTPGRLGIIVEQMTDEVWDNVLTSGPFPEPSDVSKEKLETLRRAFTYSCPFDIRSSDKDLIPNHLTLCIYNHVALFPEEHWPLSMRTNGHLMLNGKKMAKGTGDFMTMTPAIRKWGADATQLGLADAEDGTEDANFEDKTANASILRPHTLTDWSEEMVAGKGDLRTGEYNHHDRVFEDEIIALSVDAKKHYVA